MKNKTFFVVFMVVLFFATLAVVCWLVMSKNKKSDVPAQTVQKQQIKDLGVDLHTVDIGEWKFLETTTIENMEGLPEKIPVHVAYYEKKISDSRIEESAVYVYRFSSKISAQNELLERASNKGCGKAREKESGIIIFECSPDGVWWASNNYLINIGDSPRTAGLFVDAYDLVVCSLEGCENKQLNIYAPKDIFDVYVQKYPVKKLEKYDATKENERSENFRYDENLGAYYGNLTMQGYASVVQIQEGFCEKDCKDFEYVRFNILSTENQAIFDYIGGNEGNSFLDEKSIGMGCVDDDIIWRYNDSDEYGMQKYTTLPDDTEAILDSSRDDPVTIKAQRFLYTGGRGAPDCYSHFAKIYLVE